MEESGLERTYHNGEVIIRQGDNGEHMYVLQSGQVEIIRENSDRNEKALRITVLDDSTLYGKSTGRCSGNHRRQKNAFS